jgi:hypothetical protein
MTMEVCEGGYRDNRVLDAAAGAAGETLYGAPLSVVENSACSAVRWTLGGVARGSGSI